MPKNFETEREGQIEFFKNYSIPYDIDNTVLTNNTDGIYNGCLLEFKLNINSLNKVLFQAIKYLSKMRVKGEDIPATIILIDLNAEKAYQYKSMNYKDDIHKIYIGAASKENEGFSAGKPDVIYEYSDILQSSKLKKQLKGNKSLEDLIMPIDIDENCIVGWGERYYREVPNATKGDFLGDDSGSAVVVKGEIREPKHFKGHINPYNGRTNEKFKYLMDCLNDRLSKKDLGAFYTPMAYAKKATELVEMAVKRALDKGKKDYIILDRCAGTGNLESALIGLKDSNGEELISHCVVSTYEYYEYKVLNERIGDLVRDIIPPTEADVVYANGKVSNADAMSEEFIKNPIIQQYLDDENCAVILFENPPYRDMTVDHSLDAKRKNNHFIAFEAKKELKGTASNDLANLFIWSGFKFYLRQSTDSYIVFSPIKYWKTDRIISKEFVKGFIFNRENFHATASAITCILWNNVDEKSDLRLEVFGIDSEGPVPLGISKNIIQCQNVPSKLYDKSTYSDDSEDGICCNFDGTEHTKQSNVQVKKLYNKDIIGYMKAKSYNFDAMNRLIVRCGEYDAHGCFLRRDNYMQLIPLWVAKLLPIDHWWDKGIICTTSDGGDKYTHDPDFLKSCLVYTCLSNQNKCLTFNGSDGRHYQNELCFDSISIDNECMKTLALQDLEKMKLDQDEQELIELWNVILEQARQTGECDPDWTYGVYQVSKEINTYHKEIVGNKQTNIYDYPELNGNLETLRSKLKEYYKSHITEKMFEYELLK